MGFDPGYVGDVPLRVPSVQECADGPLDARSCRIAFGDVHGGCERSEGVSEGSDLRGV